MISTVTKVEATAASLALGLGLVALTSIILIFILILAFAKDIITADMKRLFKAFEGPTHVLMMTMSWPQRRCS